MREGLITGQDAENSVLSAWTDRVHFTTGNTHISLPNMTCTWSPEASPARVRVRFLLPGRMEIPGVDLPGVGRDIGEDGHLMDVGVVLGVDVIELRMERGVAGARQTGKSLVDLYKGIALVEVGVVVLAGHP